MPEQLLTQDPTPRQLNSLNSDLVRAAQLYGRVHHKIDNFGDTIREMATPGYLTISIKEDSELSKEVYEMLNARMRISRGIGKRVYDLTIANTISARPISAEPTSLEVSLFKVLGNEDRTAGLIENDDPTSAFDVRTEYRFTWTPREVLRADQNVRVVPSELDNIVLVDDDLDDIAELSSAREDFSRMTSGDVDELRSRIDMFCSKMKSPWDLEVKND